MQERDRAGSLVSQYTAQVIERPSGAVRNIPIDGVCCDGILVEVLSPQPLQIPPRRRKEDDDSKGPPRKTNLLGHSRGVP